MRLQFVILILGHVGEISMSMLEQKDFSEFRKKTGKAMYINYVNELYVILLSGR